MLFRSPGQLVLTVGRGETQRRVAGSAQLPMRTWHQVVLVHEAGQIRVYLDGRTEVELQGRAGEFEAKGRLYFGGASSNSHGLEGKLDEVATYSRALKSQEVSQHFRSAKLPNR